VNIGFDLDGVLMRNPFETCVLPRLEALLSSAPGIQALDEETVGNAVRSRVGAGWRSRMATGDLASAYDWDAVYRQVAGELGADAESLADIDVAAWVRECCGDDGHIAALPGAPELLRALEEAGHRLVVISNGYAAYQEPVLAALGLLEHFDEVVTPERVGHAKPDPRIFAAAGPLDVFVGDTLIHDVLGANRAGIFSVWVSPALPDDLAAKSPRERATTPTIAAVLRRSLEGSPHTRFHPEADERSCRPGAVVTDMYETGELLSALELPAAHGERVDGGLR